MDFGNKKRKIEKYDANRIGTFTQNMNPKLIGLTHINNLDISLPLDLLRDYPLFRIILLLLHSCCNRAQIRLAVLCMTIKIQPRKQVV